MSRLRQQTVERDSAGLMSEQERREKQAAAKQTFVAKHIEEAPVTRPLIFHEPLTNESSASADSRARQRGTHE